MSGGSQPSTGSGDTMDEKDWAGNGVPIGIRQVRFDVVNTKQFLTLLRSIADENGCHLIVFDAEKMAGELHVRASISHAMRAFRNGSCISHSLEMEALLYAAGTRQTNVAMQFGVHGGRNTSYLCCIPDSIAAWSALKDHMTEDSGDWEVISNDKRARLIDLFGITSNEVEAVSGHASLTDLILERVALLEVLKL